MKMDFKNFLKNYGRIRENFRGFFGRLFVGIFAEFNEKFGEFKMGFLNFAMKNSAKFLNLLNFKAKNSINSANLLNFTAKSVNFKAMPEFQSNFGVENSAKFLNLLNFTANLAKSLNLKAKNSSITKTKKGLLYENENPA